MSFGTKKDQINNISSSSTVQASPQAASKAQILRLLNSAKLVLKIRQLIHYDDCEGASLLSDKALRDPDSYHGLIKDELQLYSVEIGKALMTVKLSRALREGVRAGGPDLSQFNPNSTPDLSQLYPDFTPDLSQLNPDFTPDLSQLYPDLTPDLSQLYPDFTRTCHNFTHTSYGHNQGDIDLINRRLVEV